MASYSVKLLEAPTTEPGSRSVAYDLNNDGHAVGFASKGDTHTQAVLWKTQSPILIRPESRAYGINDTGDVVGFSAGGSAFLYHSNTSSGTPTLEQLTQVNKLGKSFAWDINNDGLITGSASQGDPLNPFFPFIYNSKTGSPPEFLPQHHGTSSGIAINKKGHVAGISPGPPGTNAFFYDGALMDLGPAIYANDVNDAGQVVGARHAEDNQPLTAYLCGTSSGTPEFEDLGALPLAGYENSEAWGINNHGEIVGRSWSGAGAKSRAFVRSPGGSMQDLNYLIPQNSGWFLDIAYGINDKGQIVGAGTHSGADRAYLLTPETVTPPQLTPFARDLLAAVEKFVLSMGTVGVWFGPGGQPVPIDPEGRLWARLSPEKRDMLIGIAISELALSANDIRSREELEQSALNTIRRALDRLTRTNVTGE